MAAGGLPSSNPSTLPPPPPPFLGINQVGISNFQSKLSIDNMFITMNKKTSKRTTFDLIL